MSLASLPYAASRPSLRPSGASSLVSPRARVGGTPCSLLRGGSSGERERGEGWPPLGREGCRPSPDPSAPPAPASTSRRGVPLPGVPLRRRRRPSSSLLLAPPLLPPPPPPRGGVCVATDDGVCVAALATSRGLPGGPPARGVAAREAAGRGEEDEEGESRLLRRASAAAGASREALPLRRRAPSESDELPGGVRERARGVRPR